MVLVGQTPNFVTQITLISNCMSDIGTKLTLEIGVCVNLIPEFL